MEQYRQIAEKIKEADGILIGASNGLSIAEGYNIFADDERFCRHFYGLPEKVWEPNHEPGELWRVCVRKRNEELLQPYGLPLYVSYTAKPFDAGFICACKR